MRTLLLHFISSGEDDSGSRQAGLWASQTLKDSRMIGKIVLDMQATDHFDYNSHSPTSRLCRQLCQSVAAAEPPPPLSHADHWHDTFDDSRNGAKIHIEQEEAELCFGQEQCSKDQPASGIYGRSRGNTKKRRLYYQGRRQCCFLGYLQF